MKIIPSFIELETGNGLSIHDLNQSIQQQIKQSGITNGTITITSQHTTTALTINENEERLVDDIKVFFKKLIPADDKYLHNDIHLRDCPDDEPENAHSHLTAMLLGSSESIAIINGELILGQYQSVMLCELDGPRHRKVSLQIIGE